MRTSIMIAALVVAIALDNVAGRSVQLDLPTSLIIIGWFIAGFSMDVSEFMWAVRRHSSK